MNRTRTLVCLLLFFILSCVGAVWYGVHELPWNHKYAETPAPVIFNEVVGIPVPKGVTHLKVAPRHFFIKRWAWLRFNATPQALNILLKDATLTTNRNTIRKALEGTQFDHKTDYTNQDLKKVGWSDVDKINQLQVYEFYGGINPGVWFGYLIVERSTNTIFICASGD